MPLLLCLGCQQHFVQLLPVEINQDANNPATGGPAGFACRLPCPCSDGTACSCLLFERAADRVRPSPRGVGLNTSFGGATAVGSAVVDLMTLGPGPSDANPNVVIARCAQSACTSIARKCFPLDLTAARDAVDQNGALSSGTPLEEIFTQLDAQKDLVTTDAPHDELLVRMVTTALSCDQIAQLPTRFSDWPGVPANAPYGQAIFGCGYTGPVHLDTAHDALFLGLPTLDPVSCVPQVAICADDFDPRSAGPLLGL